MEMEVIDDEESQELNQDPYSNFGDISVNDPPLPSVHLGCDGNAGESRDSGVAINSVPDAQAIVKYVNTSASIIKEAFVVSGTTLKARDFSDNDSSEIRKFTRYADDFSGKASIILRLSPDQTTIRRGKNEIKIWMILNELRICPLTVTMISHFSAEAEYKDFRDANHALDTIDVLGDPVKLKANLEQRFVVSKGVISDWPSSIPELWSSIQDKSKILSMERMYRRKWDPLSSKTSLVATDNIIVTFKDKNIRNLTIFDKGIVLRVRRYVPQVRQCPTQHRNISESFQKTVNELISKLSFGKLSETSFAVWGFNCFRFGHTKLNCKSETRCIICGDKAHGRCEREQRCYNCGGCHKSTFRGCPQFEKTKNINIVMAHIETFLFIVRNGLWREKLQILHLNIKISLLIQHPGQIFHRRLDPFLILRPYGLIHVFQLGLLLQHRETKGIIPCIIQLRTNGGQHMKLRVIFINLLIFVPAKSPGKKEVLCSPRVVGRGVRLFPRTTI
ncbi:uncharacterized protein [Temnothorax longispinosus]|uniref:uncharacterized protein n=1 Tax=Temnothorax longispinosus TaxID=300112 RepID=UPI003A99FCCC